MDDLTGKDALIGVFVFETKKLLEDLEELLLKAEKNNKLTKSDVDEVFRIMHTIKGSASMLEYNHIAKLAHGIEDLFYYIREKGIDEKDIKLVYDFTLKGIDYIREKVEGIQEGKKIENDEGELLIEVKKLLSILKHVKTTKEEIEQEVEQEFKEKVVEEIVKEYELKVIFEEGAEMENVRSYALIHNLEQYATIIAFKPEKILEDESSVEYIKKNGFEITLSTKLSKEEISRKVEETFFIKTYEVNQKQESNTYEAEKMIKQSLISVNVEKLDKLMNFMGELVIAEEMVIGSPDLIGKTLPNFYKTASQLRKLTDELQDTVMDMRMVPLATTFHKMERIVRDMSKKLDKKVDLIILGEETEVDKNIIDHLSDPLMHLIRNAVDHGIEDEKKRLERGKAAKGKIIIEAENTGGDIRIKVSDDGAGLDTEKILEKAYKRGIIKKQDEALREKEIYNLILLPGFSTNEEVNEFSGRGVGLDVVKKNLNQMNGSISIESTKGKGTTFYIKIPLTLAIIAGMQVATGEAIYTVPTISVKMVFKPEQKNIIVDTSGNEFIVIRETIYPVLRLHDYFNVPTTVTELTKGIMLIVENDNRAICLFADRLIGEQQIVIKSLPSYVNKYDVKEKGISGCVILSDGSISLVIDVMAIAE